MKKQIFILTMLTLAFLFAGVKSYGQYKGQDNPYLDRVPDCVPAVSLYCSTDDSPLNPIPGKEYDYTIDVQPEVGSNAGAPGYIRWFVYNATSNGSLISDGVLIDADNVAEVPGISQFLLSASAEYNSVTNTSNSITIQWQSFDGLTNHILLVAYVLGEDGCADNIEAYRIEPAFSFTLDVASLMPNGELVNGGADPAEECVSPVWSAKYNQLNPNGTLAFDYGANYVFFSVNAANFVHSWQPKLEAVHDGGSSILEIAWAYRANATSNDPTDWHDAGVNGLASAVEAQDGDAVGALGECIVVRVLVEHGDIENDEESIVTLTVNGTMFDASADAGKEYDTVALKDLDEPTTTGAACAHDDAADTADYILIPRPKIESATGDPDGTTYPLPFVPPVTP